MNILETIGKWFGKKDLRPLKKKPSEEIVPKRTKDIEKEEKKRDTVSDDKPREGEKEKNDRERLKKPTRKFETKNVGRKKEKNIWKPSDFPVDPEEGKTRFHDLCLPDILLRAVCELDFKYCTPIQAEILPRAIDGRDATAQAQTGTGKTAAFLVSIMTNIIQKPIRGKRMKGVPRALILAPTRELAIQIEKDAKALAKFSKINILCMIGGTGFDKQKNAIKKRPLDILVATPGRLLDFARRKMIDLRKIETLVIDEADRMLDMGFIPDITKIVHMTPPKKNRQTLFFSATLSDDVLRLAARWTRESFKAEIEPERIESESVDQKIYLTTAEDKFFLLYNIVTKLDLTRVLIFTNRRDQARGLAGKLCKAGIKASLLSGELTQSKRTRALENFRSGKIHCLVATDVAARGLHIEGISHVVNYNIPQEAEHYVHRIGRTGRAGCTGVSISFADELESFNIPPIEKVLGHDLECEYPPEEFTEEPDLSGVVPVRMEPSKPVPRSNRKRRPRRRYGKKPKYAGKRGPRKGGHAKKDDKSG